MGIIKRALTTKLMGVMGTVNSFLGSDSSSRKAMLSAHLDQAVSPKHSDIPRVMTGAEPQLAAWDIRMPVDGIIESVHFKYRRTLDQYAIKENPLITIIYQCQETGVFDTIDITPYHQKHRVFGSKFGISNLIQQLRPGMHLKKGTILCKNSNTKEGGIFSNGLSTSVVNLSLPATIEDGFCVSESFCERASLMTIQTINTSWGKKLYPLNIYGTENEFKAFPDIGDYIRPDGLVFAMRERNPMFDALEMTNKALMHVDMIHDTRIYGTPNAKVLDITVLSGIGESKAKPNTPSAMTHQCERYIAHTREYYNSLLTSKDSIEKNNKYPVLSPRLITLFANAYADQPNSTRSKHIPGSMIKRVHKGITLDEYRVEITYMQEEPINRGAKITDYHGGKGVICYVLPDADMPVDSAGNRADVIKFAKSVIARMNVGQLYEQFVNAASRDMSFWIRDNYGKLNNDELWIRLIAYYHASAPDMCQTIITHYKSDTDRDLHLKSIVESGIFLYIQPDSPHLGVNLIPNILKVIKPTYGPVTYKGLNGQMITTKDKAFIGIQQLLILEKTDHHPMSVSSGVLQHHGLLAGTNKVSKASHPSKVQAIKVFSETEVRLFLALLGRLIQTWLLTSANSKEAHRDIVQLILDSNTPSCLGIFPRLKKYISRPLMIIKNTLLAFGLEMVNTTDNEDEKW